MCSTVMLFEELEFFAFAEIVAFPAALDFILPAALSYLTAWWSAVASACLFTAHLRHRTKKVIKLIIVLEFLEEGNLR